MVVYVIDNSGSLKGSEEALLDAFDDLTGGVSLPNVQLAALKHGYRWSWGRGFHSVEKIKNSLFAFRPPDDTLVNTLRKKLSFNNGVEQLYPGIMAAWKMIEDECPPGDDLTAKPWCERKVIVALGDGAPGTSPVNADYFPEPYADAYLPTNLLSGLKNAGIRVDTLCVGYLCEYKMGKCNDPLPGTALAPGITWFTRSCVSSTASLRGREIMEALSTHTDGEYHGVAD